VRAALKRVTVLAAGDSSPEENYCSGCRRELFWLQERAALKKFCTAMRGHKINSYRKKWLLHPNSIRGERSDEPLWAKPRGL